MLSEDAHHLYDRLVASGGRPVDEVPDHELPVVHELLHRGLVFRIGTPVARFRAVSPATAMRRLLDDEQRGLLQAHRRLMERYAELDDLGRQFPDSGGGLELLAGGGADEAAQELVAAAREQCRIIYGPALAKLELPAKRRVLVDVSRLADTPGIADETAGVDVRTLAGTPAPMLVTDRGALVGAGPGLDGPLLLIRGGSLLTSLVHLFDLLWERAVPLAGELPPDAPSAVQLRILRLAAAGVKDEAIARTMGRSVRWVRRHFEILEELLGATNRMTLGIAATRRNWV